MISLKAKQKNVYRLLGRALPSGQNASANQLDSAGQKRQQQILSQVGAPVMRKTLHRDFGILNCAGDQRGDMGPEHTIHMGESSEHQHHVHGSPDGAEEPEEYDWYVPAVSPSLACTCPVLMQYLLHQCYLSRSHPSGGDRPPIAKLCAHVPPAMLRRLDLDDIEAFGLRSS